MKTIRWNSENNKPLKTDRGVSFEDVVSDMMAGDILDPKQLPNQQRYPGQKTHVIAMRRVSLFGSIRGVR